MFSCPDDPAPVFVSSDVLKLVGSEKHGGSASGTTSAVARGPASAAVSNMTSAPASDRDPSAVDLPTLKSVALSTLPGDPAYLIFRDPQGSKNGESEQGIGTAKGERVVVVSIPTTKCSRQILTYRDGIPVEVLRVDSSEAGTVLRGGSRKPEEPFCSFEAKGLPEFGQCELPTGSTGHHRTVRRDIQRDGKSIREVQRKWITFDEEGGSSRSATQAPQDGGRLTRTREAAAESSTSAESKAHTMMMSVRFPLAGPALLRASLRATSLTPPSPRSLRAFSSSPSAAPITHNTAGPGRSPHVQPADVVAKVQPGPPTPRETPEGVVANVTSGAPAELRHRLVRIYKPTKTTMQSAKGKTKRWILDWDVLPGAGRWENPLMGWASSADYMQGTALSFSTKEQAVAFAERQGWDYQVSTPHDPQIPPKNYASNYVHVPGRLRIHHTK